MRFLFLWVELHNLIFFTLLFVSSQIATLPHSLIFVDSGAAIRRKSLTSTGRAAAKSRQPRGDTRHRVTTKPGRFFKNPISPTFFPSYSISKKNEKMANPPWFGSDPVAHGSSGLKSLRRRTPTESAPAQGRAVARMYIDSRPSHPQRTSSLWPCETSSKVSWS